jgi:immune inhibitor A
MINNKRSFKRLLSLNKNPMYYLRNESCLVSPSPELQERIKSELAELRSTSSGYLANTLRSRPSSPPGLNDGLIYPGPHFPIDTAISTIRSVALEKRAPLRGEVRVIAVLVEFPDKTLNEPKQHFEELFFSSGVLTNGSVKEYFHEVSAGLVEIVGEVVGPYTLPHKIVEYANGNSGMNRYGMNARIMARHAVEAAAPDFEFPLYDNDRDGYVDAFIVIHAGSGAESTGNPEDIWSHKWVLNDSPYDGEGTKVYSYLTVPEEAKIGVCCHELGHLLFGFPDLYDIDDSSEGVGNWCLMGGGSWLGNHGEVPAHPSAWCKAQQGWVTLEIQTQDISVNIEDVKTEHKVYRLWKNGIEGNEYFLIENRQKSDFDRFLPGDGLLIWHVDDLIETNSDESHPKVALVQADGQKDLELGNNRGDSGDPFPGSVNQREFNFSSSPNSQSYSGLDTCVSITNIGDSESTMNVNFEVKCKINDSKSFWQRLMDCLFRRNT